MSTNILPELAAAVMGLILSLSLRLKYMNATTVNTYFRQAVYAVTFVTVWDMLSSSFRTYFVSEDLHSVYTVNTTIYYLANLLAAFLMFRYIITRADRLDSPFFRIYRFLLAGGIILIFANFFTGYLVTYDENAQAVYGTLHLPIAYGISFFFLLSATGFQLAYRSKYTVPQRAAMIFASSSLIISFILQFFFFRDILFTYAIAVLALYLVFFAVETPVFRELSQTTERVLAAKEEADEMTGRALAASRIKSNFLANTTHEIRTPMNAILGMNEMIRTGTSSGHIRAASAEIASAGESLLQIINDVLDYSRIESGRMTVNDHPFSLSDVLLEVEDIWRKPIEDRGIKASMTIDDNVPDRIKGDQEKLCQILMNLVSNASKYTQEGSITGHTRLDTSGSSPVLSLSISDTGTGIREEELPRVFELFGRASIEENRDKQGAGLGLKISEELAKMMGGEILVESTFGEGSTFTLRVPLKIEDNDGRVVYARTEYDAKLRLLNERRDDVPFTAPDVRVLVVDDTVVNLTVAKGQLKPFGCMVETALNGADCLNMAKKRHYDIILLDHMMPEMDGVETLHELRALDGYGHGQCVIIALTANIDASSAAFYLGEGFDDCLGKPMQAKELSSMMRFYLSEAKEVTV